MKFISEIETGGWSANHRLTASRRLSKIRDYYPDWGNMVNQRGDYQDFLLSFYWEHL